MRILTLVAGENSLPEAIALTAEIRSFNKGIDFRLRFLHIEIEEFHAARPSLCPRLREAFERTDVREVAGSSPLEFAARLALLLAAERPDLMVIAGGGELLAPGVAAASAHGTTVGFFGSARGSDGEPDARDLGGDPHAAVGLLTGVAREFR